MSLNYTTIGRRIKEIRRRNHLSQQMLSELIDKSPTYVSYIESGTKGMSLETFIRIANALKVSSDFLLAEHLRGSDHPAGPDLAMLLTDCNDYERFIILDAMKALKTAMRERRHLLKRVGR